MTHRIFTLQKIIKRSMRPSSSSKGVFGQPVDMQKVFLFACEPADQIRLWRKSLTWCRAKLLLCKVPSTLQCPSVGMLPSLGTGTTFNEIEVSVCVPVRPVMVIIEPPGIKLVSHLRVNVNVLFAAATGVL